MNLLPAIIIKVFLLRTYCPQKFRRGLIQRHVSSVRQYKYNFSVNISLFIKEKVLIVLKFFDSNINLRVKNIALLT